MALKKEVIAIFIFVFYCQSAFSLVEFSQTKINITFLEIKEITFDITNDKNDSVTYYAYIYYSGCNDYISECKNSDILLSTFQTSTFLPNEKRTAILTVESKNTIENEYNYEIKILENEKVIISQPIAISVIKKEPEKIIPIKKKRTFQVQNSIFVFPFVLVFCYFGLKLFIKTFGKPVSKEIFVLVLLVSAIIITITLSQIFNF